LTALVAPFVSAAGPLHPNVVAMAAQNPPPAGGGAPPETNGCVGSPKTPPGQKFKSKTFGAWLCGTGVRDQFWGKAGDHHVRLYQGRDYVDLRNGVQDEVLDAGSLDPKSRLDRCDTVNYATAPARLASGRCSGVRAGGRSRISQTPTYPHNGGALECRLEPDGRRIVHFLRDPLMRAADASPIVDSQTVAWTPLLYSWDGTKWVFVLQHDLWLWDRASDEQVTEFPGNQWRRFDNNKRWFIWFYPSGAGIYRVAIKYHWYATPKTPAHEVLDWAGPHYGPFEELPGQSWCNFK
jgi:hypothetical protein